MGPSTPLRLALPERIQQLRWSREPRPCRGQALPPLRGGLVRPRGLEHVPQQVGSGLVRAQKLLRALRLLERIFNGGMGMGLEDR